MAVRGPRPLLERLNNRSTGDQAFLVRERESTTELQRAHRHRQPRESDDAIHYNVGWLDKIGEIVDDLRKRKRRGDLSARRHVGNRNYLRTKLECLTDKRLDRTAHTERDYLIAIAFGAHDIKCLFSD